MSKAGSAASSELRLRVLSSLVLGAVALLSAWLGGWLVVVVWLGAAAAVGREWVVMTGVSPRNPLTVFLVGAVLLIQTIVALSVVVAPWDLLIGGLTGAVALCVTLMLAFCQSGRARVWMLAGLIYAAAIATVPIILRLSPGSGMWPLLWMFAVVWSTDVVAYFVGRAVGGPKLWPAVSPKKTWSGFLGGLVGAVIAGTSLAAFATTKGTFDLADAVTIICLSALASIASQGGDLAESAMKRHFGVKDSGTLIPGHGGFMDRLDGFAAVALLLCILLPFAKFSLWTVAP